MISATWRTTHAQSIEVLRRASRVARGGQMLCEYHYEVAGLSIAKEALFEFCVGPGRPMQACFHR